MATKAGGIGVWAWDVSTGILTWNERMYDLYDIPPDVLPTYGIWRSAVHPDDLPATESLLKHAVEGTMEFNTTFRIIRTTGAVRYLGAAARVEKDRASKPQRVTGINWDLTDRRQAEETLKKSGGQVRLLLNSTAEAIYGIDWRSMTPSAMTRGIMYSSRWPNAFFPAHAKPTRSPASGEMSFCSFQPGSAVLRMPLRLPKR